MADAPKVDILDRLRACVRSFPGSVLDGADDGDASRLTGIHAWTVIAWCSDAFGCIEAYAALPPDGAGLRAQALFAIVVANIINVGVIAQLLPSHEDGAQVETLVRVPIQSLPRTRILPTAVAACGQALRDATEVPVSMHSTRARVILSTIQRILPALTSPAADTRVCDKHLHELWAGLLQVQQWTGCVSSSTLSEVHAGLRAVCVRRTAPALLQLLWNRTYACFNIVGAAAAEPIATPRVVRSAAAVELARLVCVDAHASSCLSHARCVNGVEALLDAVFDAINVEDVNAVDRMVLHAATILCKPPLELFPSAHAYFTRIAHQLRRLFRLRGARADVFQRVAAQCIAFVFTDAAKQSADGVRAAARLLFQPLFGASDAVPQQLSDAALRSLAAVVALPAKMAGGASATRSKPLIEVVCSDDVAADGSSETSAVDDVAEPLSLAVLRTGVQVHADIDALLECVECAHGSLCGRPLSQSVATQLLRLVPRVCALSTLLASHGAAFLSTVQACDEICATILRHASTESAAAVVLRMCCLPATAAGIDAGAIGDDSQIVFVALMPERSVYAVTLDSHAAAALAPPTTAPLQRTASHPLSSRGVLASLMSVTDASSSASESSATPLRRMYVSNHATQAHVIARVTAVLGITRAPSSGSSTSRSLPAFLVVQLLLAYTQARVREWRRGAPAPSSNDEGADAARLFLSLIETLGTDVLRNSLDALRALRAVLHMLTAATCAAIPSPEAAGLSAAQARALTIHANAMRDTSDSDASVRVAAHSPRDDDCTDILVIALSLITACTLGHSLDAAQADVAMDGEYVAYLKSMLPLLCALSGSDCDAHVVEMASAVRGLILTMPAAARAAEVPSAGPDAVVEDTDALRTGSRARVSASTLLAAAAQAFELVNAHEPALQAGGLLHLARVVIHPSWADAPADRSRICGAAYDCAVAQLVNTDVAVTNAAIAAIAAAVSCEPGVLLSKFLHVYDAAEPRVRARAGEALTRIIDGLAKANLLHEHLPALLQVCTRHGARAWKVQQDAMDHVASEWAYDEALKLQDVVDVRQSAIACTGTLLAGSGVTLRDVVYDATDGLLGVLQHESTAAMIPRAASTDAHVLRIVEESAVRIRRAAACSLALLARADADGRVDFVRASASDALRVARALGVHAVTEPDGVVKQHMLDALAYLEDALQEKLHAAPAQAGVSRTGMINVRDATLVGTSQLLSADTRSSAALLGESVQLVATKTRYLKA